jgi:DNA-binding IclR family transcriptional regulator
MPARHHRTVDRIVAILEEAAQGGSGVTLAELATILDAPKSSIQELTNGLLAIGYLVEDERHFRLGPGPFVLSRRALSSSMRQVDHFELERTHRHVKVPLFVGIRLGDDQVFIDQAGIDVLMDFVSSKHPRRPLLTTATGKVLLAYMPPAERNEFLRRAERDRPGQVAEYLEELPEIRATALAFNRGVSLPDRYAVATPLLDAQGELIAAICAVIGPECAAELSTVGQTLFEAVQLWHFPSYAEL